MLRNRKVGLFLSLLTLLFISGCTLLFGETTTDETTTAKPQPIVNQLEVHYIDVGQADSIYIKLPNGKNMVIDAGKNSSGELVVDYLEHQDVETIHYLVGTHLHEDHIGGLDDVIKNFTIENIYLPDDTTDTKTFFDVLTAIDAKDLKVTTAKKGVILFDEEIEGKELSAKILAPIKSSYSSANNYSSVIKLVYNQSSFLFTGDAEALVEGELIADDADINVDILKVGHHGSNTSSTQAFIDAVAPEISIISVGEGNSYGHPHEEIIDRLINSDSLIYRTDEAGDIVIKSDGIDYEVITEFDVTQPEKNNDDNDDDDDDDANLVYNLEVHYIDVGQADSIYIKLPNEKNMLIDAGKNTNGDIVVDYLESHSVETIHYLIGTHLHEDHIGGLDDVINNFTIENIYLPDDTTDTKTFFDVLTAIDTKGLTVTTAKKGVILFDEIIEGKELSAKMVAPIKASYSSANNYSSIIKLVYHDTSYLFTGDAEALAEGEVITDGADINADVLKVGHHGSNTSSTQAFIDAVSPEISVISVGEGNTYGHPNEEVINRLVNAGSLIYRTDEAGHIVVKSNGSKYDVITNYEVSQPEPSDEYSFAVVINEVFPKPKNEFTDEWVELYNPTDKEIDLSGYYIDDIEGGSKPIMISNGSIIEPYGYLVITFTSYIFNNDGDDARLLTPSMEVIDSVTYPGSIGDNQSWYRIVDGGEWCTTPTSNPTYNASNTEG